MNTFADCTIIPEVMAALKKMKNHRFQGLSGLVAEIIQATGDIGIQRPADLCNDIIKEGCIPDHWKSTVVYQLTSERVTSWSVVHTEG